MYTLEYGILVGGFRALVAAFQDQESQLRGFVFRSRQGGLDGMGGSCFGDDDAQCFPGRFLDVRSATTVSPRAFIPH